MVGCGDGQVSLHRRKKPTGQLLQVDAERLVVKACDEGMHYCTTDSGGEHCRRNACLVSSVITHEDTTHSVHDMAK